MNISISGIFKQISAFFGKLEKKTKIIMFSFAGIIIVGAVILSMILNNTSYVVLYSGLSSAEGGEVISQLDTMGITYKTESDGTILVSSSNVATLKMQLAAEGYPKSTLSYDLFLNQSDLLTTDYEKKQVLIFQLQERLQESIMTLQGVQNAIVTLSIPENNSYVLKNEQIETTASVILNLYTNIRLTTKQISGIELLVANSVPGLKSANVVIINSDGQQLNNSSNDDYTGVDLKIQTIAIINKVFEDKIKTLLEPVFGKNGISIAVNVTVDFKVISSQETVYTPVIGDDGIITWVERTKNGTGFIESNTSGDIPIYEESNVSTETNNTYDYSENYSAQYLVNQLIRQIQDNGGNITDMTVAAVINNKDLSNDDVEMYKELIAKSAGISTDKVVLIGVEFMTSSVPEVSYPSESSEDGIISILNFNLGMNEIIMIGGGLVLLIFIIIIIGLISSRSKKRKLKIAEEAKIKAREESERTKQENMPGEIILNETREQALKRQVKEFTAGNAETVAQLLRVWIK
ncbi:MAG: flagellar M-ring protein FliF, partial [Clostridia bacterium]|nr:flagellar M-ring protein FliF [Clostridia bacterium]